MPGGARLSDTSEMYLRLVSDSCPSTDLQNSADCGDADTISISPRLVFRSTIFRSTGLETIISSCNRDDQPDSSLRQMESDRVGSKFGGGGVAGRSETNADRRERLKKLALETIDLNKDPYFFRNHLGTYECKLCLTAHANDGSYLAHTQGKKHQTNLARRAARDQAAVNPQGIDPTTGLPLNAASNIPVRRNIIRIGRPGYKIQKIRDEKGRMGLFFQLSFPEIEKDNRPRYRFMSAYEQKVEAPDKNWQYLVITADPYEAVAFKIESKEIDRSEANFFDYWDRPSYSLQFFWASETEARFKGVPGLS